MFLYFPLKAQSYGEFFTNVSFNREIVACHWLAKTRLYTGLSPEDLAPDVIHPKNFIDLKEALGIDVLWFIDRIRNSDSLIQIIDHRNLSGYNPLVGRTPIGPRPRFPDISKIYSKEDLGLPQHVVTTVGLERFSVAPGENISEMAAHVALCAGYASMSVVGIGWNSGKDTEGRELSTFLSGFMSKNQ